MLKALTTMSLVLSLVLGPRAGLALTLANAAGDGQVSVGVDAYGSFGYQAQSSETGDAFYDPVGPIGPSSTTWESALYFRMTGSSRFLSTGTIGEGNPSGGLTDVGFAAMTPTSASSSFTYAGLQFTLEQRLDDALDGSTRVGSLLTQTYTVTNPGPGPVSFDLVRYYEGDLKLGGQEVPDGGGHLFTGGTEYVFETDVAGQPADSTNFIGITGVGGVTPATGRYEVGEWPGFPQRITADTPLGDVVHNDGPDADEFVDVGMDYDVGVALANHFDLAAGQQATYVTTTRFGTGAPADVGAPPSTTTTTTSTTTTTAPGGCVREATFSSILCRLDALSATVQSSPDLGKFQGGLLNQLRRARKRTVDSAHRVDQGKVRPARGPLRDAIQAVGAFLHRLNSNNGRKKIAGSVRSSLSATADGIQADMRQLLGQLKQH